MLEAETKPARRPGRDAIAFGLLVALPQFCVAEAPMSFPATVNLTTGQATELTLDLPPDTVYLVSVEQHHVDAVLTVLDPAGTALFTINSPLEREGVESFVVDQDSPRPIVLKLEIHADCQIDGQVTVDYRPLAPAEVPAQIRYQDAGKAYGSLDSPAEVARLYREAATGFAAGAGNDRVADALFAAGSLELRLARVDASRELLSNAADRYRQSGDEIQLGWSQTKLGLSYVAQGELPKAESYFDQAYALHQKAGYLFGMGVITNNLCLLKHRRSELTAAIDCYQHALDYFRAQGEAWEISNTLNNIGGAWLMQGEPRQARQHFDAALLAATESGNNTRQTEIKKNIALLLRGQGQYQEALQIYLEVLADYRKQEKLARIAGTLSNLGVLYYALGDPQRAAAYFLEALPLRRQAADRAGELNTLNNLGAANLGLGKTAAATDNHQSALKIAKAIDDSRGKIVSRMHIAKSLIAAGQPGAARHEIGHVLKLATAVSDHNLRAEALHLNGVIHHRKKDYETATRYFLDAAGLREKQGLILERAKSLIAATDSAYESGNHESARAYLNLALAAIESLRKSLLTPDLQASLLADQRLAGELDIELTMTGYEREGDDTLAIRGLERAEAHRMRSLATLLLEARAQIRKGVDPSLMEQRDELLARLRLKAYRKLRSSGSMRAQLEEQTHTLLTELDGLEARIRKSHPGYGKLTETPTSSFPDLLNEVPDGVSVLQYALGKKRSWLWIYSQDDFHAIEIAGSEVIEAAAAEAYRRLSRLERGDRFATQASLRRLADLVLMPAMPMIKTDQLFLVADGALHYVPFSALPADHADTPLIENYELSFVPSLTVAAQLVERPIPARPFVSVLADPAYGDNGPARLSDSADEARAIAAILPPGRQQTSMRFDARREVLYSKTVAASDIVHIAAHGVFNQEHPSLSGIVLALVDADENEIDGFVGLSDVYNLELNAALVVLSGCQTALGKTVRGEGLVGLTRGFMYAGSPRIIASLWQVQDGAAAVFMQHLYRGLLAEGLSPAAALRLAQRSMRADRRWRHPYYWAGLTLQGS